MNFKDLLREHRTNLKLSQVELAKRIRILGGDVTPSQINHWELGHSNPPWENELFRRALAAALEIDVNRLMTQLGFVVSEEDRSIEARLAADIVDRLPEQARSLAIKQLQAIEQSFSQIANNTD
jgi:transcriptional regulator with XRE-family HTH domain